MAGRGRGATLPAWMTSGGLQPVNSDESTSASSQVALESISSPASIAAQSTPTPAIAPLDQRPATTISTTQSYTALASSTNIQQRTQNTQYPAVAQNSPAPAMAFSAPVGIPMGMPMHMHNFTPININNPPFFNPQFMPPNIGGFAPMGQGQYGIVGGMPPAPPVPTARVPPTAAPVAIDPSNDITCWTEHKSDAGLKYWYNRVTLISTYDKPFCLKSPEERSIPPCAWKEYTATDGKKYYSDGKESLWTMPEEYRAWKELVDAAEQKKAAQVAAVQVNSEASRTLEGKNAKHGGTDGNGSSFTAGTTAITTVQYASQAEAAEAFKDLLSSMKVSTVAKMREVQDLCQHDPRWEALKSQGEKKQALAEYQTKRLKIEKENQKVKARKQRDAFLLMLAENTEIDARTRWKNAMVILQDDARYKNIEDPRDREELFEEFIAELMKKEQEDKRRARDDALNAFKQVLKDAADEGKIDGRSLWADSKKIFVDVMCRSDYRALDETDFRRCFQNYTTELEEIFRASERRRKQETENRIIACQSDLKELLEGLAREGKLSAVATWKECVETEAVRSAPVMVQLRNLIPSNNGTDNATLSAVCSKTLEVVQSKLNEQRKVDRRLVKDLMSKKKWKFHYNTSFEEFNAFLLKLGKLQDAGTEASIEILENNSALEPTGFREGHAEEGEEEDSTPLEQLQSLLLERPFALKQIFADLLKRAQEDHEDDLQWARKVEKKFNSVLAEYFYLPEHASIPWDDAKKSLQRRSVYDELGKTDRRRLFAEHMAALAQTKALPADCINPGRSRSRSVRHSTSRGKRDEKEMRGHSKERDHRGSVGRDCGKERDRDGEVDRRGREDRRDQNENRHKRSRIEREEGVF